MMSHRCACVARQISGKATCGLWATPAKHDAMTRILTDCPNKWATEITLTATATASAAKADPARSEPATPGEQRVQQGRDRRDYEYGAEHCVIRSQ